MALKYLLIGGIQRQVIQINIRTTFPDGRQSRSNHIFYTSIPEYAVWLQNFAAQEF